MNNDFVLRDVASMQAPSLFIVCQCRSILSWKCKYGAESSILMCNLAALVLNSKQSKTLPLSILTATSSVLYSLCYVSHTYSRKSLVIFPVGSLHPMTSNRSEHSSTPPRMLVHPVTAAGTA